MESEKKISLEAMRKNYARGVLKKDQLLASPFAFFGQWMQAAISENVPEPNAMVLCTSTKAGKPSCRMVLLKKYEEQGFFFFTNLESRKSRELQENPQASLLFFWQPLERQVIIEGHVEAAALEETEMYFAKRPRGSQLGSWASPQGQVIESREVLDQSYQKIMQKYQDQPIPLPPFWGGYKLIPNRFEFWQGREDRLHDRFQYTLLKPSTWKIERLAP